MKYTTETNLPTCMLILTDQWVAVLKRGNTPREMGRVEWPSSQKHYPIYDSAKVSTLS